MRYKSKNKHTEHLLKTVVLCILLSISTAPPLYSEDSYDFRKVKWGMTKDEVKTSEGKDPANAFDDKNIAGHEILSYNEEIVGKKVILSYHFLDNKLFKAVYIHDVRHTNDNDYLIDYNSFKDALTEKYGKPSEDKTFWKNGLYKNKPEYWGMAVATGGLAKFTKWNLPRTTLLCGIYGENYTTDILIDYASKELAKHVKSAKDRQDKGKL